MKKTKILQIGVKEWPYETSILEGKNRGGGVGKYAETLFNNMPDDIELYIITRKLKGQKKVEESGNQKIRRISTLPGRKLRIISLGIRSFFIALKIIKKEKIDIIHTHIFFNNLVGMLLSKITGVAVVIVPHSPMYHNYSSDLVNARRKVERYFERKLYRYADATVMFTQEHINRYNDKVKTHNIKFVVVHTGIKIYYNETPEFKTDGVIKLLYCGRLQKRKAVERSIEGISLLSEEDRSKLFFEIVGEGDEYENLKAQSKELGVDHLIKFHGFKNNPSEYYKNADVFLQPTHTEGLSMALLESMQCCTACIVNDWGVPFKDGSVYVLKNNSPENIKIALEYFIHNREKIQEYAIKAQKEIQVGFSEKTFADAYVKLYNDLLK